MIVRFLDPDGIWLYNAEWGNNAHRKVELLLFLEEFYKENFITWIIVFDFIKCILSHKNSATVI